MSPEQRYERDIDRLLFVDANNKRLTSWESTFLRDIANKIRGADRSKWATGPSPKQKSMVHKILVKYGIRK